MDNFDKKLNQLIAIVKLEKQKMKKNFTFFYLDETYKKVLEKYSEFSTCLEQKDKNQIKNFVEKLIDELKGYINKCSYPNKIISTFEVVIDKNVQEIEDAYELNEYFNIVFYIYNLFLEKDFNRSNSLKYEFSLNNLTDIKKRINKIMRGY